MTDDRSQAFVELAEHTARLLQSMAGAWQSARSNLTSPVALDKFGEQTATLAHALGILSERAHQLAEILLDEEAED